MKDSMKKLKDANKKNEKALAEIKIKISQTKERLTYLEYLQGKLKHMHDVITKLLSTDSL